MVLARLRRAGVRGAVVGVLCLAGAMLPEVAATDEAEQRPLSQLLAELAEDERITIHGLALIDKTPAIHAPDGSLEGRLRAWLRGYNYIVIHNDRGRIRELRILGHGVPPAEATTKPSVAVKTIRRGAYHMVKAVLVAPTGIQLPVDMIVDTGATTVVLPMSVAARLGFDAAALREAHANTAAGQVSVRLATLPAVRVGAAEVEGVTTMFIADAAIGDKALLGMSFLKHFRLTMDDAAGMIHLRPLGDPGAAPAVAANRDTREGDNDD